MHIFDSFNLKIKNKIVLFRNGLSKQIDTPSIPKYSGLFLIDRSPKYSGLFRPRVQTTTLCEVLKLVPCDFVPRGAPRAGIAAS